MSKERSAVQNGATVIEDVRPIIDEEIVNIVKEIFEAVSSLDILEDIFADLTERLVTDLKANSLLDFNLELSEDQRKQLLSVIVSKGNEACQNYLANLNTDGRTKNIYALVRGKTMEKKFLIKSETIEKVVDGYNNIWNYHYQEYTFNDKYPDADVYALRIPQGCFGIKAMLMSNRYGIKAEYTEVELENGGKTTVIFDMIHQFEAALKSEVLKLTEENKTLREELAKTQTKLKAIAGIASVA
jgi:hypothetical protein